MQKEFDRDIIVVHADLCILKIFFLTEKSQVVGIKDKLLKNITKTLVLAPFFVSITQAHNPQNRKDFTHDFTVGLESFKYHYGEKTPKQKNFMQLNGMIYGVNGAYQLTYRDTVLIRPELRWAYGRTDYSNPQGSVRENIPSIIIEPRLLLGVPFQATKQLSISPYSGIGWRYKREDCTDILNQKQQAGWNRINKSWYIPIGTRFQYDINDRWDLRGFLEYNWFIRGSQSTYHKPFDAVSDRGVPYRYARIPSTTVYKQKEGWGAKAEMLVGYRFDKVGVAFGPYVHYLHIQTSSYAQLATRIEERGVVYNFPPTDSKEPNNTTKEIGLKVNFYF